MTNPLSLAERTILVTGASSGIGQATAVLLSRLGARVVVSGRNPERLQETLQQMEGSNHSAEPFDLAAVNDISDWVGRITEGVGPLYGVVHAAGIQITRPLRFLKLDDVQQMITTNVLAAIALTKAFRQKNKGFAGGSIVFVSSVMGVAGQPAQVGYSASKGALVSMTKSLALELARDRIRVNSVAPGVVTTQMSQSLKDSLTEEQFAAIEAAHPLGLGSPLDVANAIAFLLAETGRWITGTTLVVDGGYTAH